MGGGPGGGAGSFGDVVTGAFGVPLGAAEAPDGGAPAGGAPAGGGGSCVDGGAGAFFFFFFFFAPSGGGPGGGAGPLTPADSPAFSPASVGPGARPPPRPPPAPPRPRPRPRPRPLPRPPPLATLAPPLYVFPPSCFWSMRVLSSSCFSSSAFCARYAARASASMAANFAPSRCSMSTCFSFALAFCAAKNCFSRSELRSDEGDEGGGGPAPTPTC